MLEIYFTRHGETEWNLVRRMQGQMNSPLTELGKEQAVWLEARLAGKAFTRIYTSPTGRAKETALIINRALDVEVVEDDRLKEIFLGDWEGKLIDEIDKEFPQENNAFWNEPDTFHMEGKEDFQDVRNRAGQFFEEIIKKHGDEKILVVAHAIILKGMLNYIKGESVSEYWEGRHILPTSLTKINVIDNRYTVVYEGDTGHHKREMEQGWFLDDE